MFRVSKVTAIMSGRNFQSALKDIAHRVHISEAALARDRFHAVLTFFQSPPRGFDTQTLDKFRRRAFHFLSKNAREIAWTHRHALRQHWNGERFVQIVEDPGLELAQWFSIGRLQRERGAELRLSARPPQIEHEIARYLQRQP